ncbi:CPBP family intramembrane metalloprotease [Antarcticibacterium flavum]|uniref:CPBP family intramembrane metalloprotease n=1 Tax=Antarcticibacterium flavum TaxID=2058175 RepID=A0A5B7X3T4_9FLAO|nr:MULTISPECIES: type II CAAX endopeptidase family protein [Antarcticibacterium]MCM4161105.1 hypothetical protein [Antarcticibacterium sp. W02-3]QCY69392.1 CPBP family intramembrane metalloprotease [Antarcticibacterium flavum]
MRAIRIPGIHNTPVRPAIDDEGHKMVLGVSLMILLAGDFCLQYLAQTYFAYSILELSSPGFWLLITNAVFISVIVLLNKQAARWSWSELGLGRPDNWWRPILVTAAVFIAVVLLSLYVKPYVEEITSPQNVDHLMVIQQNLPLLISALILVWITAAFLREVIFRAFLINTLDILLGRNRWSPWAAVVISSLIFGLMHAWQGLGGIILTGLVGLVFGTAYLLNKRRVWPLIFVHGLLDTIALVSIYNLV